MNTEHADRSGYPPMERPPVLAAGPLAWLRRNLFSGALNGSLTVVLALLLGWLGWMAIRWATVEAHWGVITTNWRVILWGRFPAGEAWRPAACLVLVLVLTALTWIVWRRPELRRYRKHLVAGWLISSLVIGVLLRGLELPTPRTIANNIGYYLFRPDLLPLLGAEWRGALVLFFVAGLAGVTWCLESRRLVRRLALVAVVLVVGLNLPSGVSLIVSQAGLRLPLAVPLVLAGVLGWVAGRFLGRAISRLAGGRRFLGGLWAATLAMSLVILTDFEVGRPEFDPAQVLPLVQPSVWSGIVLTLVLATVTILLSFPLGVLLALGRTSRLPVIRLSCITIIEVVRGVPLITILFMAQVMLPMFLPLNLSIDRVVRAIAGMTIFTAAYLAEVIRGGLQAVPREQLEAARALGLSELLVTLLVLLPQALRLVIPAIMGQFVSVFKDTTLIAIVGLLELLGILSSITKQPEFPGTVREVYFFAAAFFFIICYAMSVASRRVEKQLGVGTR